MGQELFPQQSRLKAAKRLKADKDFSPCPAEAGDEIYPNGIFHFNITKMMEYIEQNPGNISLEDVPVKNLDAQLSTLNEDHVPLVDITKPIILAEIAPGLYNVIDGNHRLEKANRLGMQKIAAYRFHVHQHILFLTEKEAYLAYIEYWNSKLSGHGKPRGRPRAGN